MGSLLKIFGVENFTLMSVCTGVLVSIAEKWYRKENPQNCEFTNLMGYFYLHSYVTFKKENKNKLFKH